MRTARQIAEQDFGFDFIDDNQPRLLNIFGDSSFTNNIKNIQIESLKWAMSLIVPDGNPLIIKYKINEKIKNLQKNHSIKLKKL